MSYSNFCPLIKIFVIFIPKTALIGWHRPGQVFSWHATSYGIHILWLDKTVQLYVIKPKRRLYWGQCQISHNLARPKTKIWRSVFEWQGSIITLQIGGNQLNRGEESTSEKSDTSLIYLHEILSIERQFEFYSMDKILLILMCLISQGASTSIHSIT